MENDIKTNQLNIQSAVYAGKKPVVTNKVTPSDDITISPHLNQLAKRLVTENNQVDSQQRIYELQHKIENSHYKVDLNNLANRMLHTIVNK